jgi:hypothetical protein
MCNTTSSKQEHRDLHIQHFRKGKRSTLRDLPKKTLAKVSALTRTDEMLFKVSLKQFMKEISWLESDQALGHRVLCEVTLGEAEAELSYLGINVTEMYLSFASDGKPEETGQRGAKRER